MEDKSTCYECKHNNYRTPDTFLGNCEYPAKNNPERKKAIPPGIIDNGCRYWEKKDAIPE